MDRVVVIIMRSQNLDRAWHPVSAPGPAAAGQSPKEELVTIVPTITPSGRLWMRVRKRVLTGSECCRMMGLVDPALSTLSDAHKKDLAGNAFEASQAIAVICGRWAWLSTAS